MSEVILSVRDLSVDYETATPVHAVRGVSFDLAPGELLGIAGESGCGKSTLAFTVTRLLQPPGRMIAGEVVFHQPGSDPVDMLALSGEALRLFRWQRVAMVFQSAMNALNPVLSVRKQLGDVFTAHQPGMTRREREGRCRELLDLVGIGASRLSSYPHELSGGMRQRVMIAMALALRPDVVIMDEPTTALDVVVQREILDEIDLLRAQLGFAIILITHDLPLLLEISDRVLVMYAGRVVEHGRSGETLVAAHHPYTVGLLTSFPSLRGEARDLRGIPGNPPDLSAIPPGCPFRPRCPYAFDPCATVDPPLVQVTVDGGPPTMAACLQHDRSVRPSGPATGLREHRFDPNRTAVHTP
jgi:peptide/nickel transport system ATP-binding protein